MRYSKTMMSLLIAALGIALAVRSMIVVGTDRISVGLVVGLLFILYGGVRLYYLMRKAQ